MCRKAFGTSVDVGCHWDQPICWDWAWLRSLPELCSIRTQHPHTQRKHWCAMSSLLHTLCICHSFFACLYAPLTRKRHLSHFQWHGCLGSRPGMERQESSETKGLLLIDFFFKVIECSLLAGAKFGLQAITKPSDWLKLYLLPGNLWILILGVKPIMLNI